MEGATSVRAPDDAAHADCVLCAGAASDLRSGCTSQTARDQYYSTECRLDKMHFMSCCGMGVLKLHLFGWSTDGCPAQKRHRNPGCCLGPRAGAANPQAQSE